MQSLDAFFLFTFGRHFGVLARLQKNVHSAERALLRFIFFLRKIAKFCCDLERFPELGTIFRKTNSCGPIVREFEPSSYQTQRYAEIWRAFFTSHVLKSFWNVRVLVNRFAVQKVPAAESEYRRSGTKKREKKRCLDGWCMHRTARYARKNVHSVGKKKKVASPRYVA